MSRRPPAPQRTVDVQVDPAFAGQVEVRALQKAVVAVLDHLGLDPARLTVVIGTEEQVQALNRDHRGVDRPTDVLSFPAAPETSLDHLPPELAGELAHYLGDVVIAYPYAARQAARYGHPVAEELSLLAVHGVLHLLGYDHDTPQRQAEMWAVQDAVLRKLGLEHLRARVADEAEPGEVA